jgi:hypothetical protein
MLSFASGDKMPWTHRLVRLGSLGHCALRAYHPYVWGLQALSERTQLSKNTLKIDRPTTPLMLDYVPSNEILIEHKEAIR